MRKYFKQNLTSFTGLFICVFFSTAFAVVLQFFKGDILDYALSGNLRQSLHYGGLLIGFIFLEVLFFYFYVRLRNRFTAGCTRDLKTDIFSVILKRSYVSYRAYPQGEYLAKYSSEADMIADRYFHMHAMFWEIALKVLFVSIALFLLDWRIALVTLLLLTTPLYVPKLIEKKLQSAQNHYMKAVERSLTKVNDWLSGFELIKNFSIEHEISSQFCRTNDEMINALLYSKNLGAVAQLISTLISYLSYFIILAFSALLVLNGDFSAGDFFVAIGMIDQLSWPLISLSGIIQQLVAIRPACTSMTEFIGEAESRLATAARPAKRPAKSAAFENEYSGIMPQTIRFRNVSFSYEPQKPVLENFCLTLAHGKRYLTKGPSGCGKTTLINLLLRYYDAISGEITIDGRPLSQYENPYAFITVVRQEAILFHDTLRNNLTMYQSIADDVLIRLLCDLGLSGFATIQALDAVVEEKGVNFSGGEKKRICLARALLRDTPVLILDEPLANLDEATAQRIERLLLSIEGKTLLIVSHQFSEENLGRFDRVIEMS